MSFRTKTAVVSFLSGPHGYSFVTTGASVCDVASTALERFNNEWWHGPIPTPETVLRVSLVGHDRRYRVTVERVRELAGSYEVIDDYRWPFGVVESHSPLQLFDVELIRRSLRL